MEFLIVIFSQIPDVIKGIEGVASPAVDAAIFALLWSMHKENQRINTMFVEHILKSKKDENKG
jgi:hypothetical protein